MAGNSDVVLVVEDEADISWAVVRIVGGMGYRCVAAQGGHEAVSLVDQFPVRLVLLDAKLRDMDGINVARQLKQKRPDLQIVLVSGYFYEDDEAIQEMLKSALIRGFISKPFMLSQIQEVVECAMRRP